MLTFTYFLQIDNVRICTDYLAIRLHGHRGRFSRLSRSNGAKQGMLTMRTLFRTLFLVACMLTPALAQQTGRPIPPEIEAYYKRTCSGVYMMYWTVFAFQKVNGKLVAHMTIEPRPGAYGGYRPTQIDRKLGVSWSNPIFAFPENWADGFLAYTNFAAMSRQYAFKSVPNDANKLAVRASGYQGNTWETHIFNCEPTTLTPDGKIP